MALENRIRCFGFPCYRKTDLFFVFRFRKKHGFVDRPELKLKSFRLSPKQRKTAHHDSIDYCAVALPCGCLIYKLWALTAGRFTEILKGFQLGGGWGRGNATYGLYAIVEGMAGFQAVQSGIGCRYHRVSVQHKVSFPRKLINWLKTYLVFTKETKN